MSRNPKFATTDYPVLDQFKERWSPRSFDDRRVEDHVLLTMLEAARWAPSSGNGQPWRYIVARRENPEEFEKLLSCLMDGNVVWAKDAPVLMLSVAQIIRENGKQNRHGFHDVGQATAFLTLQALSHGVYVHQMGGFYKDKARELYLIPDEFEPVAAMALGYLGEPARLDDNMRERELEPRIRKSLAELVFGSVWNEENSLVSK